MGVDICLLEHACIVHLRMAIIVTVWLIIVYWQQFMFRNSIWQSLSHRCILPHIFI